MLISDALILYSYSRGCDDIADAILATHELDAAAARLAAHAAWSCLVSELVAIGRDS